MTNSEADPNPGMILVAEDERIVEEVVVKSLSRDGYQVVAAHDGAEAARIGGDRKIDLLVTELLLPRLSGWALSALLSKSIPKLKVLYLADYVTDELLEKCRKGRVALLLKPFAPRTLVQVVHLLLRAPVEA
jgi:two-component system cell cycle sensor histidine kinase/response regulator CckA